MRRLRDLATDLGGAGFFFGLAIAANGWDDLGRLRVPLTTVLVGIFVSWTLLGFAQWWRSDSSTVTFKYPRANSWVSGNAQAQTCLRFLKCDYPTREARIRAKIGNYIFEKLLNNASRATILTHDLSWVTDPKGTPLENLARAKRLNIISCGRNTSLPSTIDMLKDLGATVFEIAEDVGVRFTLVGFGGSQSLALARVDSQAHKIVRISDPQDPVFQLAKELASSLERDASRGD